MSDEYLPLIGTNINMNKDGGVGRYPLIGVEPFNPIGSHSSIILSGTVTQLSLPTDTNQVLIQALDGNVRFTLDGSTPTSTHGFQLKADDPFIIISFGTRTILKVTIETINAEFQYQFGT